MKLHLIGICGTGMGTLAGLLKEAGHDVRGATAWVSLGPCAHHGRTPPCCDALIGAGIARVVVASVDPNPLVGGQGLARLRAAGVEVLADGEQAGVGGGEFARATRELNIGFFSRMRRGRPWLRMKIAASLDGRTALPDGRSQWITGDAARADGHHWRARACAILTGIGTVRDDDPRLTAREVVTPRQPMRVLVDSRLEVPLDAQLLKGGALVVCAFRNPAKERELADRGCEVLALPNAAGKVDLPAPLGPSRPTTSPRPTDSETSESTTRLS